MGYKLLPRFQGQFDVEPEFVPMSYQLRAMPMISRTGKAEDEVHAPL